MKPSSILFGIACLSALVISAASYLQVQSDMKQMRAEIEEFKGAYKSDIKRLDSNDLQERQERQIGDRQVLNTMGALWINASKALKFDIHVLENESIKFAPEGTK